MTAERIGQIRARLASATPGPRDHGNGYVWIRTGHQPGDPDVPDTRIVQCSERDAEFIAAAPDDIAWLLAEIERMQRIIQGKYETACQKIVEGPTTT